MINSLAPPHYDGNNQLFYMYAIFYQPKKSMFWLRDALHPGNYLQHISGHPLTTLKMRIQVCIKGVFVLNEYIKSSFQGKFSNQNKLKGTKISHFWAGGEYLKTYFLS